MLKRLDVQKHWSCTVLMEAEKVFGTIVRVPGRGYAYNFKGEMGTAVTPRMARSLLNFMGYDATL